MIKIIKKYIKYYLDYKNDIQSSITLRKYKFINFSTDIIKINKLLIEYDEIILKQKELSKNYKKNLSELKIIKDKIKTIKQNIINQYNKIKNILNNLPNILHKDITNKNKIIKEYINKKDKNKYLLDYKEICNKTNIIDFNKSSYINGPRNVLYNKEGYLLLKALENLFIDHAINLGYQPILLPLLIKKESTFNAGLLPKFKDEIFHIEKDNLFLIPTAETSLINLHINEKLFDLPKKYFSFTPCFRREAGYYGKSSGGLIRLHQFYKCELIIFSDPSNSEKMHQIMLNDIESLVKKLDIEYRILLNSAEDTSFQSYKTYDTEALLKNTNTFLEISSCSNTLNFQSIRTNTINKNNEYVHILNGSCLPIERIIAIILERYQKRKYIEIPKVLQKYLNKDKIFYTK